MQVERKPGGAEADLALPAIGLMRTHPRKSAHLGKSARIPVAANAGGRVEEEAAG